MHFQGHKIDDGFLYPGGIIGSFLHLECTGRTIHIDLVRFLHALSSFVKHMNMYSYVHYITIYSEVKGIYMKKGAAA